MEGQGHRGGVLVFVCLPSENATRSDCLFVCCFLISVVAVRRAFKGMVFVGQESCHVEGTGTASAAFDNLLQFPQPLLKFQQQIDKQGDEAR